jgi:penicillin amidase
MPDFNWRLFQYEPVLQALLAEKPAHLLSPDYRSWDTLLLHAADDVLEQLKKENTSLAHATWGARNHADIRHPFSRVLPSAFARWLNLPADPLPGDTNVPRVQSPSYGASMRLVVSPGHEDEGLFEMPGGQSGHPLSPYYRAGHESWVRGEPTPLLPGKPEHTLTLSP